MRTLTLLLCAGLTRQGTAISIDINISEDSDISDGGSDRDTTSTVYKAADGNFETEGACDNTTVSVGEDLAFGKKLDNVIDLQVIFHFYFLIIIAYYRVTSAGPRQIFST